MKIRYTKARSPGPGPITKKEWSEMAGHTIEDPVHDIVMNTDSARAYQMKFNKVHHTKVVHQKKKIGKVWVRPTFVKRVRLTIQKKKYTFLAGTQTVDGMWQKIRDEAKNRQGGRPHQVNGFVRLAQFKHWASGQDVMTVLGASMPKTFG
eukprot:2764882-Amphidinium_carterae.1